MDLIQFIFKIIYYYISETNNFGILSYFALDSKFVSFSLLGYSQINKAFKVEREKGVYFIIGKFNAYVFKNVEI